MLPERNFSKSCNILTLAAMKQFNSIIIMALGLLVFHSCGSKQGQFDLDKLAGNWKDEGTNNQFFEQWKRSDSGLEGVGFVLSKGDTIMIENMSMVMDDSNLRYEVRVNNQNHGKVVGFESTDSSKGHVVFENPDHDFPQTIVYTLVSQKDLRVKLSGVEGDEPKELEFNFSRLN